MATHTTNYNLYKPEGTDDFDDFLSEFGDNMDIIDANLGGGGGSSSLAGLSDVNLVTPTDGQILTYDGNSSKWVNANGGGGGDTYYGFAIDETNKLFEGEITDFNQPMSYTATEDAIVLCWYYGNVGYQHLYINGEPILIRGNSANGDVSFAVPIRRGDVVASRYLSSSQTCYFRMVVYGIKQGTNGIFAPVIYSDVERKVGVWRDNKPLYQKVVPCGTAPAQGQIKSVAHGIADLETVVELRGFGQRADGMQLFIPNISRGNVYAQTSISVNATNVNINNGNNSDLNANYTVYMIIQYTKTTDVAGSGNWNTEGVPTVHYSTTEQVVGTWLGKPLYQITIPFSGINTYANTWYALNISSYLNNPEIVFNISDMDYYFVSGVQRMFSNTSYEPPNMLLQTNVNRTNISGHVTVRYTKTTD